MSALTQFFSQGYNSAAHDLLRNFCTLSDLRTLSSVDRRCYRVSIDVLTDGSFYRRNYPHHVKAGFAVPVTQREWRHIESIQTCASLDEVLVQIEKFGNSSKPHEIAKFFCHMPYNGGCRVSILIGHGMLVKDPTNWAERKDLGTPSNLCQVVLAQQLPGMNLPDLRLCTRHQISQELGSTIARKPGHVFPKTIRTQTLREIRVTLPLSPLCLEELKARFPDQVTQLEKIYQDPQLSLSQKQKIFRDIIDKADLIFAISWLGLEDPILIDFVNRVGPLMDTATSNLAAQI